MFLIPIFLKLTILEVSLRTINIIKSFLSNFINLKELNMKKIVLALVMLSAFVFTSCKSKKTYIYTAKEDVALNYNNELPNDNAQQRKKDTDINRSLTDYLRRIAGVRVSGNGANAVITVRGENSLNLSNEPMYIVDGIQYNGSFASLYYEIPPDQIRSVTVLKDASTLGMYGSSAANGVIEITTRKK